MNKSYLYSILRHVKNPNRWSFCKKPSGIALAQLLPEFFLRKSAEKSDNGNLVLSSATGFKGVYFFSTARMGLFWLLKNRGIGVGDKVVLQAFNCAVVPDAVIKTGATPVFVDIQSASLAPSLELIKESISDLNVKALVVQNSFGFLNNHDVTAIRKHRPDILLILDSSLSFTLDSGIWEEYREFDGVMLSFDISKPVSIISGGAMLVPEELKSDRDSYFSVPSLNKLVEKYLMNRLRVIYILGDHDGILSLVTYLLAGVRKVFFSSKSIGFVEGAIPPLEWSSQYSYPSKMPDRFVSMLGNKLSMWKEEEAVKRSFAKFVIKLLRSRGSLDLLPMKYVENSDRWVPLRIPLLVDKKRLFITTWGNDYQHDQWWFSEPIISCYEMEEFGYKTSDCRGAENIGKKIVNFPVPCSHRDLGGYKLGFERFIDRIKNV